MCSTHSCFQAIRLKCKHYRDWIGKRGCHSKEFTELRSLARCNLRGFLSLVGSSYQLPIQARCEKITSLPGVSPNLCKFGNGSIEFDGCGNMIGWISGLTGTESTAAVCSNTRKPSCSLLQFTRFYVIFWERSSNSNSRAMWKTHVTPGGVSLSLVMVKLNLTDVLAFQSLLHYND